MKLPFCGRRAACRAVCPKAVRDAPCGAPRGDPKTFNATRGLASPNADVNALGTRIARLSQGVFLENLGGVESRHVIGGIEVLRRMLGASPRHL